MHLQQGLNHNASEQLVAPSCSITREEAIRSFANFQREKTLQSLSDPLQIHHLKEKFSALFERLGRDLEQSLIASGVASAEEVREVMQGMSINPSEFVDKAIQTTMLKLQQQPDFYEKNLIGTELIQQWEMIKRSITESPLGATLDTTTGDKAVQDLISLNDRFCGAIYEVALAAGDVEFVGTEAGAIKAVRLAFPTKSDLTRARDESLQTAITAIQTIVQTITSTDSPQESDIEVDRFQEFISQIMTRTSKAMQEFAKEINEAGSYSLFERAYLEES